ncbi:MAG: sigma-70 family RNA polymerase sigma factor [Bacteroidota bacterium]
MSNKDANHSDWGQFELFCKNNRKASEAIYEEFFPKIKKMVLSNHGDEDDAWDIFQEGLIVLYRYCNKEEFSLNVPLYYFFSSICRRLWLKVLEKRRKSEITFSNLSEYKYENNAVTLPEDELLQAHRLQVLLKHLELLPVKGKQTLKLYYMEGKSHREIAELVGFSNEASAKVQKFKYLRRLQAMVFGDREFE